MTVAPGRLPGGYGRAGPSAWSQDPRRNPPRSPHPHPPTPLSSASHRPTQQFDIDMMQQGGEPFLVVRLAASRTRSSPWDRLSRLGVRRLPCPIAFPSAPSLGSTGSSGGRPPSFAGFFSLLWKGLTSHDRASPASALRPSRCGPSFLSRPAMRSPGSQTRGFAACQGLRPRGTGRALAIARPAVLPSATQDSVGIPEREAFAAQYLAHRTPVNASSQTSQPARMTRGQCGSLYLHRKGLAPSPLAGLPAHALST